MNLVALIRQAENPKPKNGARHQYVITQSQISTTTMVLTPLLSQVNDGSTLTIYNNIIYID